MKFSFFSFLIGTFILLFIQCNDETPTPTDTTDENTIPVYLDIQSSETLVFVKDEENGSVYEITPELEIKPVVFLDEDKEEYKKRVDFSFDYKIPNNDIVLKSFNYDTKDGFTVFYAVVDKETNKIYQVDQLEANKTESFLFTDKQMNYFDDQIVYFERFKGIDKLDISDLDNVVYNQILETDKLITAVIVDAEGNVMYSLSDGNKTFITKTGSSFPVLEDDENEKVVFFWNNSDNIYYIKYNSETALYTVIRADFDNDGVERTELYSYDDPLALTSIETTLKADTENETFFVRSNSDQAYVYNYTDNTFSTIVLPEVEQERNVKLRNGYLYIQDKSSIYKVSTTDFNYEYIFQNPAFQFYDYVIRNDNVLLFSAYTEGKYVIGSIDSDKEVTILSESMNNKADLVYFE